MEEELRDACTVVVHPDAARIEIRVHDSSWRGVLAVRNAVVEWTVRAGTSLCVDLHEIRLERASSFWIAALVSMARIARARDCVLVLVAPPARLVEPLSRLRLDIAYEAPGRRAGELGRT